MASDTSTEPAAASDPLETRAQSTAEGPTPAAAPRRRRAAAAESSR